MTSSDRFPVYIYLNLYRQTVNSAKQQTTTTQVTEGNTHPLTRHR